jgi:hypothetical protein
MGAPTGGITMNKRGRGLGIAFALAAGCAALLLNGCATPQGGAAQGPQGEVLFYGTVEGVEVHRNETVTLRDVTGGSQGPRHKLLLVDKTQWHLLPAIPGPRESRARRFACAPGKRLFRVQKGEIFTQVEVEVAAGKLTRVPLTLTVVRHDDSVYGERAFMVITGAPEAPVDVPPTVPSHPIQ